MVASDVINSFVSKYHELSMIQNEAYTDSQARSRFLRNITDPEYKQTVEFLRNTGSGFLMCVNAIRKKERDLNREKIARRNFRNQVKRTYNMSFEDGITDAANTRQHKRVKRVLGELETTKNGFISIQHGKWKDLEESEKTFMQEHNEKVKHGDSVSNLEVPKGVIVAMKARLIKATGTPDKMLEEESEDEHVEKSSKNKSTKKIRMGLKSRDVNSDDE